VIHGPDLQRRLQGAEGPLDISQLLVSSNQVLGTY
jgi:hypothetical protein